MIFKNILKFIASVGIVVFTLLLIPVLIGLYYHEDVYWHGLSILGFLGANIFIFVLLRHHLVTLNIKESIISVNIVWILLGIAGAIPLVLNTGIDFSSAFFESISGFTTTGATVFGEIESLPKNILFHRSLTHWIGGIGIIVLGIGLLPLLNPSGSLSLFKAESSGISIDKFSPKIKDTAKRLWMLYVSLTLANMLLLMFFGMDWFDAINHAFSTISTGGFSTKNLSLGYFTQDGIVWITSFFMFISSINFLAHIRFINGNRSSYNMEEIKWYLGVIIVLSCLLALVHFLKSDDSLYTAFLHSVFTIISLTSTTGFATVDYEAWGHFAVMFMFFAMILGGNAGSTAGGVKVIRYILFFKNIGVEAQKSIHPESVTSIFVDGKPIQSSIIHSLFGFFSLFVLTIFLVMVYLFARGYDEMSALSTAIATVGNIGPGFELTGPSQNYGFFSWYDKLVLSCAMIIGRLECYTVFILFGKSFWKKF